VAVQLKHFTKVPRELLQFILEHRGISPSGIPNSFSLLKVLVLLIKPASCLLNWMTSSHHVEDHFLSGPSQ
jgi:hypothetical protein